jgi:LmbE family N-acetylglucosaminyl deacetylase
MSGRADVADLECYDSLFIAPHGDDVMLACPARVLAEAEKGRRVLVLALFEPVGQESMAARSAPELGAEYAAAGFLPVRERRPGSPILPAPGERAPEDEDTMAEAAAFLAEVGARSRAIHVYAPLGLGLSPDHALTYEAAVRAFATEAGRNLFLYEERPEAFVPGAVRTRLALLGARLPPGAARAATRAGLVRHLWRVNEPARLRGEHLGVGARLAALGNARRRLRLARPWNPLRAFGPRLQPVVHSADEDGMLRARAVAERVLPTDRRGRAKAARVFNARAAAAAKKLGGVYHSERLWLFLPSGDGLPEVQHPLERAAV